MESIERLGYELRVFIRVPDLGKNDIYLFIFFEFALIFFQGDGQDRERHRDKHGSGKSSGGKSAQSSPVKLTFSGLVKKDRGIGHVRHISGSTSAESGSGGAGAGSGTTAGEGSLHPYYGITNGNVAQAKIKYREQGVDELLQLKLHQALAATDDVPEGSTIVLATGDGNIGQFNEDGFLGPVRTALRRGWRVELYAWEDGLSEFFLFFFCVAAAGSSKSDISLLIFSGRAWRREFGEGSEFGRRGMFRIIGMEQFASGLVEVSGWS